MLSEPRTINLLTDLIHIPSKHSAERIREVYSEVCASCGYENFIRTAEGARLEAAQIEGNQVSTVNFRQDRIQFFEDQGASTFDQFCRKVDEVAKRAMEILHIPFFLVQQSTIRAIASPRCYKTAAEFLASSLFRIQEADVAPLGRPTNIVGLRLLFPPTKEHPQKYNLRIEAYLKDRRSIYIENTATFQTPIHPKALDRLTTNLQEASEFISSNVHQFLSQYDKKDAEL